MYKPEWIKEDNQRVENMNRWYKLDNRENKKHKFHGLYTGLYAISKRLELEDRMAKAYEANKKRIPLWVRQDLNMPLC